LKFFIYDRGLGQFSRVSTPLPTRSPIPPAPRIRERWSSDQNMKTMIEPLIGRSMKTMFEALGNICDMFNPDECWNFLKAAGYASD
jgi:hypothetical protein